MPIEFWTLVGMSLVTIISRIAPGYFLRNTSGRKMQIFIEAVPFVVLSCLIFPSMIVEKGDVSFPGIVGGTVAAISAWFRAPLFLSIFFAMLAFACADNILVPIFY